MSIVGPGNQFEHYNKEKVLKHLSEFIDKDDVFRLTYDEQRNLLVLIKDYRRTRNESELFKRQILKIVKDKNFIVIKEELIK